MAKTQTQTRSAPQTATLSDLNKRIGQVVREVHFTGQPIVVTDYGKPIAEIHPSKKQTRSEDSR